jgi:hypothetical protein
MSVLAAGVGEKDDHNLNLPIQAFDGGVGEAMPKAAGHVLSVGASACRFLW